MFLRVLLLFLEIGISSTLLPTDFNPFPAALTKSVVIVLTIPRLRSILPFSSLMTLPSASRCLLPNKPPAIDLRPYVIFKIPLVAILATNFSILPRTFPTLLNPVLTTFNILLVMLEFPTGVTLLLRDVINTEPISGVLLLSSKLSSIPLVRFVLIANIFLISFFICSRSFLFFIPMAVLNAAV